MVNKIEDLLEQKLESDSALLENLRDLSVSQLPGAFSLISESFSFYQRSFLRIFTFCFLCFLVFSAIITMYPVYFGSKIALFIITFVLLVFYVSTLVGLTIEEEVTILSITKNTLYKLVALVYTCLLFLAVIAGAMAIISIPELTALVFLKKSYLSTTVLGGIFAVLTLAVVIHYVLFLFIAIDDDCGGFEPLMESTKYAKISFADYLKRLVVCISVIPVIFVIMLYLVKGIFVFVDLSSYWIDVGSSHYYKLKNFLQPSLDFYKTDMSSYIDSLISWFIRFVIIIPLTVIYLGLLYASLGFQRQSMEGTGESWFHKVLLVILAAIGTLSAIGVYVKLR